MYNCQVILVFSLTLGFVGTFPSDVSETLFWVECERHCPHCQRSNPTHALRAAQALGAILSGGDGLRVTWWDVSVKAAGLWEARVAKLLPAIPRHQAGRVKCVCFAVVMTASLLGKKRVGDLIFVYHHYQRCPDKFLWNQRNPQHQWLQETPLSKMAISVKHYRQNCACGRKGNAFHTAFVSTFLFSGSLVMAVQQCNQKGVGTHQQSWKH